jgi:pantoate--beta-alanine ligase
MKVIHTVAEFRSWRRTIPQNTLAPFVPTMGALHEGHASLIRAARQMAPAKRGVVLASVFVNPTQFGPTEDFAKYPRTLGSDCALLEAAGCDALFAPSPEEMYGTANPTSQPTTAITIDPGPLATVLEGAFRPGHFRGVCTVVAKLLGIVQPTHLLLGQKDFQQQAIVRQMVADLNLPLEVVTCPTVRELDGLALSSRNRYLSRSERPRATALFQALSWAKQAFDSGERNAAVLDAGMDERLRACGLVPQYALVAHAHSLQPFRDLRIAVQTPAVALIAAKLGQTRLIDNLLF